MKALKKEVDSLQQLRQENEELKKEMSELREEFLRLKKKEAIKY